MMQQGNGGITGPNTATHGSTITVKVLNGEKTVTVVTGGTRKDYPVVDGTATVEVPPDTPVAYEVELISFVKGKDKWACCDRRNAGVTAPACASSAWLPCHFCAHQSS